MDQNLTEAKRVYETLCASMDEKGWKYEKNEENLAVVTGTGTDDLPIELAMIVEPQAQLVTLLSRLPIEVPEDKMADICVALTAINDRLLIGSFDYYLKTQQIFFRSSLSFRGALLDREVFFAQLMTSCEAIDRFDLPLKGLAEGMITITELLDLVTKGGEEE